ncbi:MAG TPA: hypothetical protein VEA79_13820 [Phenylobacterium sp.]|nr:hypothetical protein [Phenylobacterium sp.]
MALFAWWKGDWPERGGGMLNLAAGAAAFLVRLLVDEGSAQDVPLLLVDGVLAFGFLVLAMIFASLWLGGAMLLQAAQFSLHAFYIVTSREHDWTYYLVNNVVTVGVLLAIVIGTIASWWRRSREQKLEATT